MPRGPAPRTTVVSEQWKERVVSEEQGQQAWEKRYGPAEETQLALVSAGPSSDFSLSFRACASSIEGKSQLM